MTICNVSQYQPLKNESAIFFNFLATVVYKRIKYIPFLWTNDALRFICHTQVSVLRLLNYRCHTDVGVHFLQLPHIELCGTGTVSRNLRSTCLKSYILAHFVKKFGTTKLV